MTKKQYSLKQTQTLIKKYPHTALTSLPTIQELEDIINSTDNTRIFNINITFNTEDYITPTIDYIKKLHKEQLKEYKLNQAYGKEYLHYSEKPKQPIKTEYLPEEEEDDSDLLQEYYQPLTLEDVL